MSNQFGVILGCHWNESILLRAAADKITRLLRGSHELDRQRSRPDQFLSCPDLKGRIFHANDIWMILLCKSSDTSQQIVELSLDFFGVQDRDQSF